MQLLFSMGKQCLLTWINESFGPSFAHAPQFVHCDCEIVQCLEKVTELYGVKKH